jgi:hypothetical protein
MQKSVTCRTTQYVNTMLQKGVVKDPNIVRAKMNAMPHSLPRHKNARLEFCRRNMNRNWAHVSLLLAI